MTCDLIQCSLIVYCKYLSKKVEAFDFSFSRWSSHVLSISLWALWLPLTVYRHVNFTIKLGISRRRECKRGWLFVSVLSLHLFPQAVGIM